MKKTDRMTPSTFSGEIAKVDSVHDDCLLATYPVSSNGEPPTPVMRYFRKSELPDGIEIGMSVSYKAFTPHSTTSEEFVLNGITIF